MLYLSLFLSTVFSIGTPTFDHAPVFEGQIMQSTDGGKTWHNTSANLPEGMRLISAVSSETEIMVGVDKGKVFKKSLGNAQQWERLTFEGDQTANNILGLYPTPSGFYTYVIRDGLYHLKRGGQRWEKLSTPEGLYDLNSVTEDQGGNLYIASQNGIYQSQDGGMTWKHNFTQSWMTEIIFQHQSLIASGQSGIFRSEDQGQTWKKVQLFPELNYSFMKMYDTTFRLSATTSRLFAIRNDNPINKNKEGRIQYSEDGGRTWAVHPADEYLKQLPDVQNFTIDGNGHWYCSYSEGIIKSENQGQTWMAVLSNPLEDRMLKIWSDGDILLCSATVMGC